MCPGWTAAQTDLPGLIRLAPDGALEVYFWSMDRADLERVPMKGWIAYLEGDDPEYPIRAMQADFETIRRRIEQGVHNDPLTPDTRLSDNPNPFNPAVVQTLVQLMLGGLPTGNASHPLHCRVRYFDPACRRAGLPEDVAALVEGLTDDGLTLSLVNINQRDARTVIVQGGAYAEHQFLGAEADGRSLSLDGSAFTVRLAPGAGGCIAIKMKRYANQPTFLFPWDRG